MTKMIMKKSDLFKIGVLLMVTTLGTTGCSFGEDEKKPEIVVDPAEKTIEYYIAGKVTEGTTALSGARHAPAHSRRSAPQRRGQRVQFDAS